MNAAWVWFGLTALALIGEIMSGSFYLLMVAVGFAVAGIAAWLGLGVAWQLVLCALGVVLSMLVLKRLKIIRKKGESVAGDRSVNLDIGQSVRVEAWDPDRSARVWYRGAHWQALLAPGAEPAAGMHVIVEVRGNHLVLAPQS